MDLKWQNLIKYANEREARYFSVNETYATKYIVPVTGKFYARHEAFDFDKVDPEILKNVTAYFDAGPKEKYAWPITENQTYGWYSKPLVDVHRNDERFYFPRNYTPITSHEIRIKQDRTMKIPKFGGIPWKF